VQVYPDLRALGFVFSYAPVFFSGLFTIWTCYLQLHTVLSLLEKKFTVLMLPRKHVETVTYSFGYSSVRHQRGCERSPTHRVRFIPRETAPEVFRMGGRVNASANVRTLEKIKLDYFVNSGNQTNS